MKSRFTEERIIGILKEAGGGRAVKEVTVMVGVTGQRGRARGWISLATRPVQPVWWEAPSPRPSSP